MLDLGRIETSRSFEIMGNEATVINDPHPVTGFCLLQIVGCHKEGRLLLLAQRVEELPDLAPGLGAVALPSADLGRAGVAALFEAAAPTHVILGTPHLGALAEARRRGLPVLASFADIFGRGGPRTMLWNLRLRRALAARNVTCVANHSLNASRSVVEVPGGGERAAGG